MKIAILAQARMSSKRLPGKMMTTVNGKPLIEYVVGRLRLSKRADMLAVVTSSEADDDAIAHWCRGSGVECFRGPLNDVYERLRQAAQHFHCDVFVRISSDSPFIDARLIDHMIDVFKSGEYDLVTNVIPRAFPKGESVEIIRSVFLEKYAGAVMGPEDREHVTPYFYRSPSEFRIKNVANAAGDFSKSNLCVDTPEDLERFKQVVESFNGNFMALGWQECLAAAERLSVEAKRV